MPYLTDTRHRDCGGRIVTDGRQRWCPACKQGVRSLEEISQLNRRPPVVRLVDALVEPVARQQGP